MFRARERWWFRVCETNVAVDASFFPDSAATGRMTFTVCSAEVVGEYIVR